MITDPVQAEHVLVTGQADVVLVGRVTMRNPHFALEAARALRVPTPPVPAPYRRGLRH
jgi:2,4-dienoyl-CoA reductase-like NADH-dependent reductase (Old Yellow Enzyme family)